MLSDFLTRPFQFCVRFEPSTAVDELNGWMSTRCNGVITTWCRCYTCNQLATSSSSCWSVNPTVINSCCWYWNQLHSGTKWPSNNHDSVIILPTNLRIATSITTDNRINEWAQCIVLVLTLSNMHKAYFHLLTSWLKTSSFALSVWQLSSCLVQSLSSSVAVEARECFL